VIVRLRDHRGVDFAGRGRTAVIPVDDVGVVGAQRRFGFRQRRLDDLHGLILTRPSTEFAGSITAGEVAGCRRPEQYLN
jgi:hypothetical protein